MQAAPNGTTGARASTISPMDKTPKDKSRLTVAPASLPAHPALQFHFRSSTSLFDSVGYYLHAKGDLMSITSHELLPDLGPLTS